MGLFSKDLKNECPKEQNKEGKTKKCVGKTKYENVRKNK